MTMRQKSREGHWTLLENGATSREQAMGIFKKLAGAAAPGSGHPYFEGAMGVSVKLTGIEVLAASKFFSY